MKQPRIMMDLDPPRAWVETVERGVDQHNVAVTGLCDYYPVGFLIKDAKLGVLGGLLGDIWGGWMHVGSLWVDRRWRGRGYATDLMTAAERYALRKQCSHAFLETGTYEARGLYEKLDYEAYAELKDHPTKGYGRYFMKKVLAAGVPKDKPQGKAKLEMIPYASQTTEAIVRLGISYHALAATGLPEQTWSPANFFLKDDDGEILGGALGNIWGEWLYVAFLWVDRQLRGHGYGSRLITAIEKHALARGCSGAFLGTFSFQARPLYEKLGYQVFGERKDHPKGHSHYWLSRRLAK
jgi:ribosomal protein S18 acetylase RimI-like enzyme